MKLFLAPNLYTETQRKQAEECIKTLEACGHSCAVSAGDSLCLFGDESAAKFPARDCDIVVSLGGDGAVIRASATAIENDRPLVGINSGRLGFLCSMNFKELSRFDEMLSKCTKTVRELLLLNDHNKEYYALNDVVVGKLSFGETVDLSVTVTDRKPFEFRGDGLIISTPTGSSAYNLSAGGPVVDNSIPAFVITPICSHKGQKNSLVISNDREVNVVVRNGRAGIYLDGKEAGKVKDEITVKKADKTLTLYI